MTLSISLMILAGFLFLAYSSHHTKPPPQQPPPPIADFQKYTYLLCFKKTNQQKPVGWCSGFLVKLDSDIYCVTNYRLVDGVDVFSGKLNPPDQQFDSLLFRYSTKSGRVRYISFPMHQGGGPPFYYFDRSDFVLFKLPPSMIRQYTTCATSGSISTILLTVPLIPFSCTDITEKNISAQKDLSSWTPCIPIFIMKRCITTFPLCPLGDIAGWMR